MTETSAKAGAPEVAVNKRTQGIANDPTAPPDAAQSGVAIIKHTETGGITTVPRSAYEGSYRYNGWEEVDVEADRENLLNQAREMGVNVPDTADGRTIVESIRAFRRTSREG